MPYPTRRSLLLLSVSAATGLTVHPAFADDAKPRDGGTLRIYADSFSVDPRQQWTVGAGTLTDSLVDRDPKTLEFAPWLAESWSINEDATEYAFRLRPGVTFSNGDPLDAVAVKANFDGAVADLKQGGGWYIRGIFDNYIETKIIDRLNFIVRFSASNAPFLANVSTDQLGIVHPSTFSKTLDERKNFGVVGTGAFVVASVKPQLSLRLSRRKDYAWPSKYARHQGPAHLDAIEITVVPEDGVRDGALQSGEADVIVRPTSEGVSSLAKQGYHVLWRQQTGIGEFR